MNDRQNGESKLIAESRQPTAKKERPPWESHEGEGKPGRSKNLDVEGWNSYIISDSAGCILCGMREGVVTVMWVPGSFDVAAMMLR